MSILPAAATAPSTGEVLALAIVLLMTLAGVVIFVKARLYRPDAIVGPMRVGADEPIVPLLIVTIIGGTTWILSQAAFLVGKQIQWQQDHPHEKFRMEILPARDLAFLSIVPAAIALVILIIGDVTARRRLPEYIGYSPRSIVPGIARGLLAICIVLPVMWTLGALVEWVYRRAGIQHPSTHELLKAMRSAPRQVRVMLIIGACVAAPVFEEFLFRGHVQRLLLRLFFRPRVVAALPPLQTLDYNANEAVANRALMTWLAVMITSILFAAVHPLWMAPLIFVLSMSLGFAYERTGNLWTPIVIHALFNTSSTLIYLNLT